MISVLIPVKNEKESISKLVQELNMYTTVDDEIIFIDDGSTDGTGEEIKKHPRLRLITLRKNYGKSTAISIGLGCATKPYIFLMDGDLQDDPKYIPKFRKMLDEGYDCVVGWRINRLETGKKLPSRIYNAMSRKLLNLEIHDMNCGMKMFYRASLDKSQLYGEMHRFLPAILQMDGFKVGELPVEQRPRVHGKTKYGVLRIFSGFLDLFTVMFLYKYGQSPAYVFGLMGFTSFAVSGLFFLLAAYRYFSQGMVSVSVMLASLFFISGLLCFMTGLLSEQINSMMQHNKDKSRYIKRDEGT